MDALIWIAAETFARILAGMLLVTIIAFIETIAVILWEGWLKWKEETHLFGSLAF